MASINIVLLQQKQAMRAAYEDALKRRAYQDLGERYAFDIRPIFY